MPLSSVNEPVPAGQRRHAGRGELSGRVPIAPDRWAFSAVFSDASGAGSGGAGSLERRAVVAKAAAAGRRAQPPLCSGCDVARRTRHCGAVGPRRGREESSAPSRQR